METTERLDEHYSNSSLNTFLTCMKRYEFECIKKLPPDTENLDLSFGAMSHEILQHFNDDMWCPQDAEHNIRAYHEGTGNGWVEDIHDWLLKYIPQEGEYPEYKEKYGITSYEEYYTDVVIQITKYIRDEIADIDCRGAKTFKVYNELEFLLDPNKTYGLVKDTVKKQLKGIIDCLIVGYNDDGWPVTATILDYKFSNTRKTQSDFDENSQLQIYAQFVYENIRQDDVCFIPWSNIKIGYIDIPKASFDSPIILKNNTLSKAKSQNVSAEKYKKAIIAQHGPNDPYYNAGPGGYYEDIVAELSLKKAAYITTRMVEEDIHTDIMHDILDTMLLIDRLEETDMSMPRKYSSYSCANCSYKKTCKPWLTVDIGGDNG